MRLLVTGGCGFVGGNFLRYVLQHYGPEMMTNVDALSTGRLVNVAGIVEAFGERYEFLQADVADADKIEALMVQHQFFAVVHLAAAGCPAAVTGQLLQRAQRHGIRRFLLVSMPGATGPLAEAEALALEAQRESSHEVVVVRADSAYGPFQAATEWIPSVIIGALTERTVALDGDGSTERNWLHVEDLSAGLFTALLDGAPGVIHELRFGQPVCDRDLAQQICDHLGKSRDLVRFHGGAGDSVARRAEAGSEPATALDWKPRRRWEPSLRETIDWYVRNREWWTPTVQG